MNKVREKRQDKAMDRLTLFIETTGMSLPNFEQKIGVSSGYIKFHQLHNSSMDGRLLVRLSNLFPQLNIMWLITGRHKMTLENNENPLALD